MINITFNGKPFQVEAGITILEAAQQCNIYIPTLCYLKDVHKSGSCRICVVEVAGARSLLAACVTPVRDGMVINTRSERVNKTRRILYELITSDHPKDCLYCARSNDCELQLLGEKIAAPPLHRFDGPSSSTIVEVSPSITRDTSKCIQCRRCVTVCNEIQGVHAIDRQKRGFKTQIGPALGLDLAGVNCSYCGQCTIVCPVNALKETTHLKQVEEALHNPNLRKVVQVAPAIRVALGEEFGMPPGTIVTGKLARVLKQLGFDDIFDTNFAADLTILEEGTEFLTRVQNALTGKKAALPMITSCSPGWIKYVENHFPNVLEHLSTCKSPHMMFGALVKSYYADKIKVDPKDIYVVSIMPCTAKKFEIQRPEMVNGGYPNVDAVLTTRELARLIKGNNIDFTSVSEINFDNPLGFSSGAADIFGVTGGVMEAALRTVYEIVTGRELPFEKLHVKPIMGLEQIKTATIKIEDPLPQFGFLKDFEIKIAVTSGLQGAKILTKQIEDGTSPYHFIEVMGCPGGCIAGGGQPRPSTPPIVNARVQAIYREDEGKQIRKSHENPYINKIYEEFLGKPNGHKSHELLHTKYTKRGKFNELIRDEKK
ncbi:MAG: NADH-dependent [FeFe] hydrogenase, group A6 [Christensenellales bacterium]|jgi:NADP-reducing hydrogenase subunit HndD